MSFRTTGVLLAVLIALGAFVYFYEMQTPKTTESPKEKALEILNYSDQAADINRLEVQQGDKVTRLVSKEGEGWTMEAPEQAPVDKSRVISAVGEVSVLRATTVVTENASPDDLSKYGLDKPQLTVSVSVKNKDYQRLMVGIQAPTKTGYYAKLADTKKVYLVGSSIIEDLQKLVTEPPKATPTPTALPATPTSVPSVTPTP